MCEPNLLDFTALSKGYFNYFLLLTYYFLLAGWNSKPSSSNLLHLKVLSFMFFFNSFSPLVNKPSNNFFNAVSTNCAQYQEVILGHSIKNNTLTLTVTLKIITNCSQPLQLKQQCPKFTVRL